MIMATFVLVHGATAGGWVWQQITKRLKAAGHAVYTPTLTGLGERVHLLSRAVSLDTHVTDVVNVLRYEELQDVILVGHSYAGMVITGVYDQASARIRQLIYLDALVPAADECCLDLMAPAARQTIAERVRTEGDGWLLPVNRGPNDLPSKNAPHPWKCWTDPLRLQSKAVPTVPCTYVLFTADKQPGAFYHQVLETSWQRAQSRGWRFHEVNTVHQILPDPEPKAAVLLDIVE
jgi:pimeloyl-ACP methyl ester carboxylesterase